MTSRMAPRVHRTSFGAPLVIERDAALRDDCIEATRFELVLTE
jgi:hypothetical protein